LYIHNPNIISRTIQNERNLLAPVCEYSNSLTPNTNIIEQLPNSIGKLFEDQNRLVVKEKTKIKFGVI
ncbi:MAG TPA: hypothetical protein PK887_11015, partial [Ignavibacteriales bacterium]|nr:hypothetical protein [Ignavibacteriales bacterium]